MAESFSTGFRQAINQTGSVKATMINSVIGLYGGTKPTNADTTEGSSLLLLVTISSGAFTGGAATNGLNMDVSASGVLSKTVAEVWSGIGLAAASTGTAATWFRWYANAYTTGASTTAVRVDGTVGTSSAYELQVSNTTIVEDAPLVVSTYTFTFPAS